MEKCIERMSAAVKKHYVAVINFLIFVMVYGIWIFNEHYSSDSFSVFHEGMANVNLTNGRLISWLMFTVLDALRVPYADIFVGQGVLLITITLLSEWVYSEFMRVIEKTTMNKVLVHLAVIMFFVNASFAECPFGFPETCFGNSINLVIIYASIVLFMRGTREHKRMLTAASYLLLLVAISMYQVYLPAYVVLCTAYMICYSKGRFEKKFVVQEVKMVSAAAICAVLNIVMMNAMVILGISNKNSRGATLDPAVLLRNAKQLLHTQLTIWSDYYGYLPMGLMVFIGVIALIILRESFRKRRPIDTLWCVVLLGGCYFTVFVPHLISSSIWMASRTIYGFFLLIASVFLIAAALADRQMIKEIAVVGAVVFISASTVRIHSIAANNIAQNRIDEETAWAVQSYIDKYEEESGKEIETIAIGYDRHRIIGYRSVDYTMFDTNVRTYSISWNDVNAINHYTCQDYSRREMTKEEKEKYFGDTDYVMLDLDKQMVFEEDTAYWLIY